MNKVRKISLRILIGTGIAYVVAVILSRAVLTTKSAQTTALNYLAVACVVIGVIGFIAMGTNKYFLTAFLFLPVFTFQGFVQVMNGDQDEGFGYWRSLLAVPVLSVPLVIDIVLRRAHQHWRFRQGKSD